jgi:hypothetical protein
MFMNIFHFEGIVDVVVAYKRLMPPKAESPSQSSCPRENLTWLACGSLLLGSVSSERSQKPRYVGGWPKDASRQVMNCRSVMMA